MCSSNQPDPPKPPPPPAPPPPVLEQAAPVKENSLTIEDSVRKKAQGTKKYSSATTSLGNAPSSGGSDAARTPHSVY